MVNILAGYGETAGAALARHPDVDKVVFMGSTEVGKLIVQAAAGNLKKVSLELGGKSPVFVFPDANIDLAIAGAASAIFFNHGQCCCAGSRLRAHRDVFDQVVDGVAAAKQIKLAAGMDSGTEMGPHVSDEQLSRVLGYIDAGTREGASIVTGGKKGGNGGYFVEPTVMINTTPTMKVVQEEIFGPVVCAQPFNDNEIDQIAKTANDTVYGLAASCGHATSASPTSSLDGFGPERSGSTAITCSMRPCRSSGWGREMGEFVLENYTEVKAATAAL